MFLSAESASVENSLLKFEQKVKVQGVRVYDNIPRIFHLEVVLIPEIRINSIESARPKNPLKVFAKCCLSVKRIEDPRKVMAWFLLSSNS